MNNTDLKAMTERPDGLATDRSHSDCSAASGAQGPAEQASQAPQAERYADKVEGAHLATAR